MHHLLAFFTYYFYGEFSILYASSYDTIMITITLTFHYHINLMQKKPRVKLVIYV